MCGGGSVTTRPFVKFLMSLPEWMVEREELPMFVERGILATLRQPNELHTCLAYWAWNHPVNTPTDEYPICREVMQGVVVPNMHYKVFLCSSVVCHYPFL